MWSGQIPFLSSSQIGQDCSRMFCCLTVSTTRALFCMADAQFRVQVIVEATHFQNVIPDFANTEDQWLMAFRATGGNGESVYDAWYNTGTYHDFPVGGASSTPITCWSTSSSCSCPHHLRSKLLDLWQEGSISPQRVSGCVSGKSDVSCRGMNYRIKQMNKWIQHQTHENTTTSPQNRHTDTQTKSNNNNTETPPPKKKNNKQTQNKTKTKQKQQQQNKTEYVASLDG